MDSASPRVCVVIPPGQIVSCAVVLMKKKKCNFGTKKSEFDQYFPQKIAEDCQDRIQNYTNAIYPLSFKLFNVKYGMLAIFFCDLCTTLLRLALTWQNGLPAYFSLM